MYLCHITATVNRRRINNIMSKTLTKTPIQIGTSVAKVV